jgi:hypothetical protein
MTTAAELALLREALSDLVDARPDDLPAALAEFGWADLLAADPAVATTELFRLQGERLTATTMLDEVMLAALGDVAAVHQVCAIGLPPPPHVLPVCALHDGRVAVEAVLTRPVAGPVLVPAATRDGVELFVLELAAADAGGGLDLGRDWWRITGAATGPAVGDQRQWTAALAAGRRALAAELLAIGDRISTMAVEHVRDREVFGRKLAAFQVVRHKLADLRLAQEIAGLALTAAWEDDDPVAAALAKLHTVNYVRLGREHGQQLLGGMGFSWEHPLHRYLRRALMLEPLLGGRGQLRAEVGAAVLAGPHLPGLVAL